MHERDELGELGRFWVRVDEPRRPTELGIGLGDDDRVEGLHDPSRAGVVDRRPRGRERNVRGEELLDGSVSGLLEDNPPAKLFRSWFHFSALEESRENRSVRVTLRATLVRVEDGSW